MKKSTLIAMGANNRVANGLRSEIAIHKPRTVEIDVTTLIGVMIGVTECEGKATLGACRVHLYCLYPELAHTAFIYSSRTMTSFDYAILTPVKKYPILHDYCLS